MVSNNANVMKGGNIVSKILLITSRNVVDNSGKVSGVGAATLIFRRATAFHDLFGTDTYIFPLNGNVTFTDTGHRGAKFIKNSGDPITIITDFIKNNKPKVVVLSGDKTYFYEKKN